MSQILFDSNIEHEQNEQSDFVSYTQLNAEDGGLESQVFSCASESSRQCHVGPC